MYKGNVVALDFSTSMQLETPLLHLHHHHHIMPSRIVLEPVHEDINVLEALETLQALHALPEAGGEGAEGGGGEAGREEGLHQVLFGPLQALDLNQAN